MKPQELQIGDWVMPDQCITPRLYTSVAMITTDGVYMNEAERRFSLDEIHPIPLDAEILERNGFRKQKWNDLVTEFVFATDLKQSPQTVIQFSFYSKEIEGVKSLLKMWTKSKFGHGQNDVHLCGVYCVHELQHALRLCGVDKEIVL